MRICMYDVFARLYHQFGVCLFQVYGSNDNDEYSLCLIRHLLMLPPKSFAVEFRAPFIICGKPLA